MTSASTPRAVILGCSGTVLTTEERAFFRDLRPYVNMCRFPDCTHTHEEACAVKDAVADGWLDERRYESYCKLIEEEA